MAIASTTDGLVLTNAHRVLDPVYVCKQGVVAYTSSDGGHTWAFEATAIPPGTLGANIPCDPSWVSGASLFIFKTAN